MTGAAVGGYFAKPRKADAAARTPFTIVFAPDTQWQCGGVLGTAGQTGAMEATLAWVVTNQQAQIAGILGGLPLNIKMVTMAGDCANAAAAASYDAQQVKVFNSYDQLRSASSKIAFVPTCGNHDYYLPDPTHSVAIDRANIAYMWRTDKSGVWSPANMATLYGGGMDLGTGDVAFWGGVYPEPGANPESSINCYVKAIIQGQRIGFIGLEFCPRVAVLTWAKGIMDANPSYWWMVTTHGYQDVTGARCTRGSTYGPTTYSMGAYPASTSGDEMWGGGSGWAGFTASDNLAITGCGHWIDGYTGGSNWVYQKLASTATGSRGQTVQQIFCNCQGDGGSDAGGTDGDSLNYTTSMLNGTSQNRHLLLMTVDPRTNPVNPTIKTYLISTNNGKYLGASAAVTPTTTPIELSSFSVAGGRYLFPAPGALR